MKSTDIWVYILILSNGRYYTGMTKDIARRMKEHNTGMSKSTKRHLPVKLIYVQILPDRTTARRLETKIKRRGAHRYLLDKQYKNTSTL